MTQDRSSSSDHSALLAVSRAEAGLERDLEDAVVVAALTSGVPWQATRGLDWIEHGAWSEAIRQAATEAARDSRYEVGTRQRADRVARAPSLSATHAAFDQRSWYARRRLSSPMRHAIKVVIVSGLAVLSLFILIVGTPSAPEALRAYRGDGERGILSVQAVELGKTCRYRGTWASEDNTRTLKDVLMDDFNAGGECRYQEIENIPTLYVGDRTRIYLDGDRVIFFQGALMLGSLIYLGVLAALLAAGHLRRNRDAGHSPAPRGPRQEMQLSRKIRRRQQQESAHE